MIWDGSWNELRKILDGNRRVTVQIWGRMWDTAPRFTVSSSIQTASAEYLSAVSMNDFIQKLTSKKICIKANSIFALQTCYRDTPTKIVIELIQNEDMMTESIDEIY